MSDRFYSLSLGQHFDSGSADAVVQTSSTTAGASFEFRVTYDATGVDKSSAIRALRAIEGELLRGNWPPA